MVTLRDLLPLIKWNDVRIINAENGEEEICSIGKEYLKDISSFYSDNSSGCSLNDCNRFYCGVYWVVHWCTASKLRSELYVETRTDKK